MGSGTVVDMEFLRPSDGGGDGGEAMVFGEWRSETRANLCVWGCNYYTLTLSLCFVHAGFFGPFVRIVFVLFSYLFRLLSLSPN